MKRQNSDGDWAPKKASKLLVDMSASAAAKGETSGNVPPVTRAFRDIENLKFLPNCWTPDQAKYFLRKYDGLLIKNKKLGCSHCANKARVLGLFKGKSYHISSQWQKGTVTGCGVEKKIQQASLRKKMREHFESTSHLNVVHILNEKDLDLTGKIFNIVYSLVKRNRSMSDMEDEIELHIKNGVVNLGNSSTLASSATRIAAHIAESIRDEIFSRIIQSESRICIVIDEVALLSSEYVFLIFLKCEFDDCSPTLFLDLIELEAPTAANIYNGLRGALNDVGFNTGYLRRNLIGFCSDGASTTLGRDSGVPQRVARDFPDVIIWHCLSHRLQLVVDDAITEIEGVNHFKIFLDRIYAIFDESTKSQLQLEEISEELSIEIDKIGFVFDSRWASCSLSSAKAVWNAYPALYSFFSQDKKFSGMQKRLKNKAFIKDLALIIDILDELALLSNALQERETSFTKADKLMKSTINFLMQLKDSFGMHEKEITELAQSDSFKCIEFEEHESFESLPRDTLIQCIIEKMTERLLNEEHIIRTTFSNLNNGQNKPSKLVELFSVLDPSSWGVDEVRVSWKLEDKLHRLKGILKLKVDVSDFREYVENTIRLKNLPDPKAIRRAKKIMNTIAISSAEVERGLSLLNCICSESREVIDTTHVSSAMTINLLGKSLRLWDPLPYVKSWMTSNKESSCDVVVEESTEAEVKPEFLDPVGIQLMESCVNEGEDMDFKAEPFDQVDPLQPSERAHQSINFVDCPSTSNSTLIKEEPGDNPL